MNARVTWKNRLNFEGLVDTGFALILDAEPEVGGEGKGFKPMELLALGLAGCTAMDVISILQKKRQDITNFEVQVHAERAQEHPKVFTKAVIEYFVTGHGVDQTAVVRAIELSATRYCPAQAMFANVFPMALRYHIFEKQEGGDDILTSSAEYSPARE